MSCDVSILLYLKSEKLGLSRPPLSRIVHTRSPLHLNDVQKSNSSRSIEVSIKDPTSPISILSTCEDEFPEDATLTNVFLCRGLYDVKIRRVVRNPSLMHFHLPSLGSLLCSSPGCSTPQDNTSLLALTSSRTIASSAAIPLPSTASSPSSANIASVTSSVLTLSEPRNTKRLFSTLHTSTDATSRLDLQNLDYGH
ncbi:unnamed protein product [Protopolystoma xenopodis]|uniref:Uncharacterized protein n=1 Tax=Protopolystoma xenopodis TaxID=117903 RepID=A0A3S5BSJ3_9PLAT|nr:unnamed protein product [Protopolystoma xenopodis]